MSSRTIAKSAVAAIFESKTPLAKPAKAPGTGPARPFAQTVALVNAQQASRADNTVGTAAMASHLPAGDELTLVEGPLSGLCPAMIPDKETLSKPGPATKPGKGTLFESGSAVKHAEEDLLEPALAAEAGRETSFGSCQVTALGKGGSSEPVLASAAPVRETSRESGPTGTEPSEKAQLEPDTSAKPAKDAAVRSEVPTKAGKSEDRKTPGLEALIHAAEWNLPIRPGPLQFSVGRVDGPTGPKATTGVGSVLQDKESIPPSPGKPPAQIGDSKTLSTGPAGQGDVGGAVKKSIPSAAAVQGAMSRRDGDMPSEPQVALADGKPAVTARSEDVAGSRAGNVPERDSFVGREYVVEPKRDEATTPVPPEVKSDTQHASEASDRLTAAIEAKPQPDQGEWDDQASESLLEAPRDLPRNSGDARSHGRTSLAAVEDSAPSRQVAGETLTSAAGKEATSQPSGSDPAIPLESALLATDGSAFVSVGASDRVSVAASIDQGPVATGVAPSVGEQIHDAVRASLARGDQQVVIRLRPPELGNVVVRFEQRSEQIDGVLEVSCRETRNEVERALPQVVHTLQELGLHVRKLEVTLSDPPQQGDSLRQQPQHDAWAEQRNPDRSGGQTQRFRLEPQISHPESGDSLDVPAGRIDLLA